MATNYNYFGNLVTSGLVLDLDAAKIDSYPGSGTIWRDISGNNYSGSLINGPTFTGIGKQAAIVFDGTDDRVVMNTASFSIRNSGDPISINVWTKPGKLGGQFQDIFTNRLNNSYNWILYQHLNDGSIQFHGTSQNKSAYIPVTGSWINVAATVTPSKIYTLYFNGSPYQTSASFEYGPSTDSRLSVGYGFYTLGDEPYSGSISIAQMYNRSLSQFEVWQNFNAIKGRYGIPDIVTNGLVLNLDAGNPYSYLSGSSGTTWTNTVAVSSSISGTLVNGPVYANGAITFDGVDDYVNCGTSIGNFGTSNFTINFFFKTTQTFSPSTFIAKSIGDNPTSNYGWLVNNGSTGNNLGFAIATVNGSWGSNGSYSIQTSGANIRNGIWQMATIVGDRTQTNVSIYLNGILQTLQTYVGAAAFSTVGDVTNNQIFSIGSESDIGASPYPFSGSISSTQIYNRALSAAEITQNFNALRGRYGI
jgi:hypothetical protein